MDYSVLAYIEKDDEYLLLYRNKKEHDINEGKWIGVGGHIEKGETPEMALVREIKEETNLDVLSYQLHARILFIDNDYEEIMYLYTIDKYEGQLSDCDEGELKFIKKKDMYHLPMWEGDKIFLDKMMNNNEYFELTLRYKNGELIEVDNQIKT